VTLVCANCGGEFERRGRRGPIPRFCSPECRTLRERERRAQIGVWAAVDRQTKRRIQRAAAGLGVAEGEIVRRALALYFRQIESTAAEKQR
jgi:hypothetical protein